MKILDRVLRQQRAPKYIGPRSAKGLVACRAGVGWIFQRRHGVIVFVARTALFSLLIDIATLVPLNLVRYWLTPRTEETDVAPLPILELLVIGPLFENALLVGLIEFLTLFELRRSTIVVIVVVVSGVAHGLAGGWRAISGMTGFAIMAISYFVWSERWWLKRYFITVAQHVTMNVPFVVLSLLLP